MRRRHGSSLIRRADAAEEDVDPNKYITNLADCMLVMTVGLLVALVARFGVDLHSQHEELVGVEVSMDADGDGRVDDAYEPTGTVYRDSSTGKYYLVEE